MTFKKLLIVDDSELDRLTLQKIAEKNGGHSYHLHPTALKA